MFTDIKQQPCIWLFWCQLWLTLIKFPLPLFLVGPLRTATGQYITSVLCQQTNLWISQPGGKCGTNWLTRHSTHIEMASQHQCYHFHFINFNLLRLLWPEPILFFCWPFFRSTSHTISASKECPGLSSLVMIILSENMDISQVEDPVWQNNGIMVQSPHDTLPTFVNGFDNTKLLVKCYIDLEVSLMV